MSSIIQDQTEVKTRECCVCHESFQPEDESQVLCPGCEELGIRCGCVMPWQSCAICQTQAALNGDYIFGDPVLDNLAMEAI
jgi:hypothetical protein